VGSQQHAAQWSRCISWEAGRLLAALLALISLSLGAWLTLAPAQPAGAGVAHTISGTVTKTGGLPVEGLTVYCAVNLIIAAGDSCGSAQTASDGSYVITTTIDLDQAIFGFIVGVVSAGDDYLYPSLRVELVSCCYDQSGVDFAFSSGGGRITGTVTANGGLVASARIIAVPSSGSSCEDTFETSTLTDDLSNAQGDYSFTREPGTYRVCARADGLAIGEPAGLVTTESEHTTNADIQLVTAPPVTISGTVSAPGGDPLANAIVSCAGPGCTTTQTAADGTFSITGPGRLPQVVVSVTPPPSQYLRTTTTKNVSTWNGGDVTDIDFTLVEGGRIAGSVTSTTGPLTSQQVSSAQVTVLSDASADCSDAANIVEQGSLAPDATYNLLEEVGSYRVCARITNGSGATADHGSMVNVVAGQTTTGVDVSLQVIPYRTISGVVKDGNGQPVANAAVSCGCFTLEHSAADGTFSILGLGKPGLLKVDPPASRPFLLPINVPYDATGGDVSGLQITLPPAGRIQGTISTPSGQLTTAQGSVAAVLLFTPASTGCNDDAHRVGFPLFPHSNGPFDLAVPPGTYRVCATTGGFARTDYGLLVTVVAGQITTGIDITLISNGGVPPGAPTIGAATPGSSSAQIAFTPPVDNGAFIHGYSATCSAAGHVTAFGSGTTSPIQVGNLDNGTQYGCSVRATGSAGDSPESGIVFVTPGTSGGGGTPPGVPTIGTALAGDHSANISFTPGSNGGQAAGFTATCSAAGHTTRTGLGIISPTSVFNLDNGVQYTCTVHATTLAGSSPESGSVLVTPGAPATVPGAPGTVTAAWNNVAGQAVVSFAAPTSNGGSAVNGYKVTCTAAGKPSKVATKATSPITIVGLLGGITYSCTVQAQNAVGLGGASAPAVKVGTPAAPPTISAIKGATNGSIKVTWGGPGAASPITGYVITCTATGSIKSVTVGPTVRSTNVTALTRTKSYTCKAAAKNKFGTGLAKTATATKPK
jgi:hypothetical protein